MCGAARAISLAVLAWAVVVAFSHGAAAQERVVLEALPQDGYARLILTFPERMSLPEHTISSENGVLVVEMTDTTMRGSLPDVGAVLGNYLAIARFDPDMTALRMGLRGPFRLNTIAAGEQLYIDLLPLDWVGLPPALPDDIIAKLADRAEDAARIAEERRRAEMVAEYNPVADIAVGTHPTFSRVIFDWNVGTKAEFTQDGLAAAIKFDWPVPIDIYPLISNLPVQVESVENEVDGGGSTINLTLAEDVDLRFYENTASQFILDINNPAAETGGVDIQALIADAEANGVIEPLADEDEAAVAVDVPDVIVPRVSSVGQTVRVVFPFHTATASAVFRRGDTVWMLFDSTIPIAEPDAAAGSIFDGLVTDFSVQAAGASQVVRMDLSQDRLATIGSEGMAWVLSLGDTLLSATEPVSLNRRRDSAGFYEMMADLGQPSKVHQLRDPVVGDVLDVVTVFPPARGVVRDFQYVDFSAPRSIHGLVIKPHHQGVGVRIEDRLAVISGATGLTLSDAQTVRFRMPEGGSDSALDLASLNTPNPLHFAERKNALVHRTATTEGRELDRARLELAQFYLGNGLAQEAIGILEVMRRELRQEGLDIELNATLGAASALAGRVDEALAILNSDDMRDEADAMIWRTIVRAESGRDYAAARLDAMGAESAVAEYPSWVRSRFLLAAARAAVMHGDAEFANKMLNTLELSTLTRDQMAFYELFGGMVDKLNGHSAEALESFGRVIAADRRPTTAEAVLRTIELLDEMDRLDLDRAISTLSVQATIWRGGPLELEMTSKLADLMYRNSDFRDAFVLTHDVAALHADSPVLDGMVDRARTEFAGLYLDGKADALEPIEALSIYYDYRQLTPPGTDGDVMIRNLAQRLIKVDLLAQAADLLEYQVDNRLEGAARAQVAADLAVVHIANHDPSSALRVINATRLAGLPPGLERQRRVLEASALINAGRQELALDMLSSLTGRDAELLRIDALWQARRYREASERIEMLYATDADAGALSPMGRTNIVKAAVGYVLANDAIGITRLRSRFSDAMADAPEWPMFALVTEDMDATGVDFRDVARKVANTDAINGFLNAYREIYAGENALTPLRAAPQQVASVGAGAGAPG
ncbi:hypothetical protein SAMN04487974_11323 [Pelagibacterium luteolum]|uniref:Tetratricopeptide repeat-containing protein n=1 Tax=Pelagibacterium luteolum TaxID=440168 RepID=A0A1G7YB64_9HYPH|nr:hypothetical protein SAMN04487974_11323 [Pelagibacterium luteolum]